MTTGMSSTVTTTTVSTIVAASPLSDVASVFTLVAVACLMVALVSRELSSVGAGVGVRRLRRGLDIAAVPLFACFALAYALKLAAF